MNQGVNPSPTVSVILSVYNGEQYLHQAIDSILTQTFSDFEFIIVDDGSTDRSAEILKTYQDQRIIRLNHSKNQGLIASLNAGLSHASGQFIARIDEDDISLPDRLEEQIKRFNEDPQLVIVGSYYHRIDEVGTHIKIVRKPLSDTEIRWTLLFENPFGQSLVMVRADALQRHRLRYDKEMVRAEDFDLWSRLLLYGKGENIAQPLGKIRRHPRQVSAVFFAEQLATADRIIFSNLQQLGIVISILEVRKLRIWMCDPRLASNEDIQICQQLLGILSNFGKQKGVDPQQLLTIRYRWVNRILGLLFMTNLFTFNKIGLLGLLVREHRTLAIRHLIKRIIWNIKKRLQ